MFRHALFLFCASRAGGGDLIADPMKRVVAQLLRTVPPTFTAVSQIAFSLPDEVKDDVGELGGLRTVLEANRSYFSTATIGKVLVVRRHDIARSVAEYVQPSKPTTTIITQSWVSVVPGAVRRAVPRFVVPMSAIVEAGLVREQDVESFLSEFQSYLDVVDLRGATSGGVSLHLRADQGNAHSSAGYARLFVRLHVKHHTEHDRSEDTEQVLHKWNVEEHEKYRIARLLPVRESCVVDESFCLNASAVLTADRDVLHVLASDPHLFLLELRSPAATSVEVAERKEYSAAEPQTIVGESSRSGTVVIVRFLLSPQFFQPGTMTLEEIHNELELIKEARRATRIPPNRELRRKLLRSYQYLVKPLPHLDHLVFAYYLFDVVLGEGAIDISQVMTVLPEEIRNCAPVRLEKFVLAYPHLLYSFKNESFTYLQRADIPRPVLRDPLSVPSDEVVMSLCSKVSARCDPATPLEYTRFINVPHTVRKCIKIRGLERILRECPSLVEIVSSPGSTPVRFRFLGNLLAVQQEKHNKWKISPK